MERKKIIAMALLLLVAAVISVRAYVNHMEYVRGLEEFHVHKLQEWVITQRGFAYRLDRAVAEVLAAPDADTLSSALGSAHETAYAAREALWAPIPLQGLRTYIDRWDYSQSYQNMGSYLYYLLDTGSDLGSVEVSNLELMREHTEAIYGAFDAVLSHIQYEELSASGTAVMRTYPWRRIIDDDSLAHALDSAGLQMRLLRPVGYGDSGYRSYLDSRRSRWDPSWGLARSGERMYSEEEMLSQARAFVRDFHNGRVVPAYGTPRPPEGDGWIVGSGSYDSALESDYLRFALMDQDTQWTYEIDVTEIGGHLFQVELSGTRGTRPNPGPDIKAVDSLSDLKETARALVDHWAKMEGVILEPVQSRESYPKEMHIHYAQVVKGVLVRDSRVEVRAYLGTDSLGITIDAKALFHMYGWVPDEPEITPEQAVESLSPHLTATGEPWLETRHGLTVVYAIPVEGVDRVDVVYVNAVTGGYEGMDYQYSRP